MKSRMYLVAGIAISLVPLATLAQDTKTAVGGGVGGAAGAAVGSAVGGKTGAVVGGAVGGATGAAVTTKQKEGRTGAIVGGAVGGGAGAAVGQSVGGTGGAVLGAGVGGAAGAVVGRNIGASQSTPQTASGTVGARSPGATVAVGGAPQVRISSGDRGCGKWANKNHPGKGWAKGHANKGC